MKFSSLTRLATAAALAAALPAAFADGLPSVPDVKFVGAINGHLCITLDKSAYPTNLFFQVKSLDFPETDWRTVEFTHRSTRVAINSNTQHSFYMDVDKPGETLVRVAETNSVGEHAGWQTAGPVTNCLYYATTEKIPGANGYVNTINDGIINTAREATYADSGQAIQTSTNVWMGVDCGSLVDASMVRYVPRQDSLGLMRMAKTKIQCADDAAFLTNLVNIANIDYSSLSLGRVYEVPIEPPAKARYFRIMRTLPTKNSGEYISIDEIEVVRKSLPKAFSISAANSGDWTNDWPAVTWSVPAEDCCNTGVLQRALSAAGPFSDVSSWTDATAGERFVDSNVMVGVTYYYRAKAQCVAGGHRGVYYSDVVSYTRARRLERSWDDLTTLNDGMSVMYPLKWAGNSGSIGQARNSFDGNTATYTEATCYTNAPGEAQSAANRVLDPVVGVDLGAEYHITGALVYPRDSTANLSRARDLKICGADEEAFTSCSLLSGRLGGFANIYWQYTSTTNTADKFRFVFLWAGPVKKATYGNVAEVGFYGFSDQDIVDSGLLIPPTTVSCETNATGVAVSWDRGWNAASYRIDRRRAGAEEWTAVASVETNELSYVDGSVPRRGEWQWRVTAVAEGGDTISSLPCRLQYYDPRRGLVIKFH